ncbi:MAG: C39 family peptidase [Myxococcaceae bacterium]|nr:C39 family peptidase [Myxococcaceae bacterium]
MVLLLALISAATPPGSFHLPNVPHVKQKPDYCGEACVEMTLKHFGRAGTQDDVFVWSGVDPKLNRGVWTRKLKVAVERGGFEPGPVWFTAPASDPEPRMRRLLDEALADLRAGWPSIFCMHHSSSPETTEHFRLLVGYEDGGETLVFEDPALDAGPVKLTRAKLFELWPLKYDVSHAVRAAGEDV